MKEKTKEILIVFLFILFIATSLAIRLSGLADTYSGATGYIHQHGMIFAFISSILPIIGILLILVLIANW